MLSPFMWMIITFRLLFFYETGTDDNSLVFRLTKAIKVFVIDSATQRWPTKSVDFFRSLRMPKAARATFKSPSLVSRGEIKWWLPTAEINRCFKLYTTTLSSNATAETIICNWNWQIRWNWNRTMKKQYQLTRHTYTDTHNKSNKRVAYNARFR